MTPRDADSVGASTTAMREAVAKLICSNEPDVIYLRAGYNREITQQAVAAIARDGNLYARGGGLVRVLEVRDARAASLRIPGDGDQGIVRDQTHPVLLPVTSDYLRVLLDRIVTFRRIDRDGMAHPADCPLALARGVLALGEWDGVRPLRAITRAPFLRSDGTICAQPGYDAASVILLAPNIEPFTVPEAPTLADAMTALDAVLAPFAQVTWAEAVHQSAYVAFLLTLAARPILPTAPAFIFSAPTAGTGKTLLLDCAALVVNGTAPAKRTYPRDADEMRKLLHSVLLAGDPVFAFDNVRRGAAVGGESLNMYLTAEVTGDRTLGASAAPRLPNVATFAFTGNNIAAHADFVRRAIAVRLDPDCEHPESRAFTIPDLRGHVLMHRQALLCALLTLLRAFVVAGAPRPPRPALGAFEQWDRLVSGCVCWLGMVDPVATQEDLRQDDEAVRSDATLFEVLQATFPCEFKAAAVRKRIEAEPSGELAEAVTAACGDVSKLGYWLRGRAGQICGGRKLKKLTGERTGHASWRVDQVG